MDFTLYEAEDFATDESYLRYFFRQNHSDVTFWENWISIHPERLDFVMQADQMISFLSLRLPEGELNTEFERINQSIQKLRYQGTQQEAKEALTQQEAHVRSVLLVRQYWWAAAAMIILLLGTVWLTKFTNVTEKNSILSESKADDTLQLKQNNAEKPLQFRLPDGSVVTLQPGAVVRYPEFFTADKRIVNLDGEAFFEVVKNPEQPFYVVHEKLITRVLGTSFNVKTINANGQVEVSVRTGKIEVYEQDLQGSIVSKVGSSVILKPNQKVIYEAQTSQFVRQLVDLPLPIIHEGIPVDSLSLPPVSLEFDAVPLSEIIPLLGKVYGIDINFETPELANCHFSGDISNMNLFVKLDILCKSINASYEVNGITILLKGKGCN